MVTSLADLSNRRSAEMFAEFPTIEFRDVWQKNDTRAEADVMALWARERVLPSNVDPAARVKEICVAAYEKDDLVGISTVTINTLQVVRQKMAFFRILIANAHRTRKLILPLGYAMHQAMERYALAHPKLQIAGTAAVVTAAQGIYKPVSSAEHTLIGYTSHNEPVLLRWFDHFRF